MQIKGQSYVQVPLIFDQGTKSNLFASKNYAYLNFNKVQGEDGKFYVPADTYTMDEQITTYRYIYSMIPSITYNLKF